MTRGRDRDILRTVAADLDDAREQFSTARRRDRARLREWIQTADQEAVRCEHDGPGALTQRCAAYHAEYEEQAQIVAAADAHAAAVRAEVAEPLIEQAAADGTDYLTVRERMWQAHHAPHPTGRFGKRQPPAPHAKPHRRTTPRRTRCADAGGTSH